MNQRAYRRVFQQFLNEYWGAFHEVLEAQSVNPKMLAASLFDGLVDAHRRFAAGDGTSVGPEIEALARLWTVVASKRKTRPDAPLSAREITCALALFKSSYDALAARGALYPLISSEVHSSAVHGTPRTRLRPDAAA